MDPFMRDQASQVVRRRHRLTVAGVERACDFIEPLARAADPQDPRLVAAIEALRAACAVRRRSENKRRRES